MPAPPAAPERPSLAWRRALVAIALVALLTRVVALDAHTPWFDELLELGRAQLPLVQRVLGRPIDQDPPLYALFLGAWQRLGPAASAFWPRLPSALAGTLAAVLAGAWAARLAGRRVGVLAALLMALSPVHVHYAREINQYAFVALWSVALLVAWERVRDREYALVRAAGLAGAASRASGAARRAERRATGAWLALGLLSLVALGTHYGMAFPLAVIGIDLGLRAWATGRWRAWLAWTVVMAVALGLLLALGLGDRLDIGHVQKRFGGTDLAKELGYIADVGWREVLVFTFLPFAGGVALPIVRALTALAAVGGVALWRRSPAGRRVVGGWLGGTLALTYLGSLFGLYPLGYRHGLFNAPVWLLLVAAGIDALAKGAASIARKTSPDPAPAAARIAMLTRVLLAALVCAAFIAFSPLAWWPNPDLTVPREDLGPVLAATLGRRQPGDGLYVYHGAELAARFLRLELGAAGDVVWGRPFDTRDAAAAEREAARIEGAVGADGQVWTLWTHVHPADRAALETALLGRGRLRPVERVEAPGAFAVRYARAGPRSP